MIIQQLCTDSVDNNDITQWCHTCGVREHIFRDDDPVEQLLKLAIRDKTEFQKIICIAHNARSFDAQFILKRLTEGKNRLSPSVILNGQNIVSLEYGRTKFIDSLNYFQMKLSNLPDTFGLPESKKKGYFPHLFNTLENQEYVGPLPEPHFYVPDSMTDKERNVFYAWYRETRATNNSFDFQKEIIEYCRMDVEILRRACVAFRKIFLEVGNTEPFVVATTIASACSHLYRKNFLKPKTIGIIPTSGYRRGDKHSQKAVEWLLQCEREIGREIIHAARSREFRMKEGFLVDGYLPAVSGDPRDKGIVFEYQGCYTHGCKKCFKNNRDKKTAYGRTFNDVFENTKFKIEKMRSLGYEVREIWKCTFDRVKRDNPEIGKYVREHPLMSRITLNPREAFYGGRTENIVTNYEIKEHEVIRYTDICSLYPYVCKRGRFPLGHPRIYVGSECASLTGGNNNDLSRVEGLVKCKILPPRNLFLPLLPVKMHNRLLFALCRTCCEESRQSDCIHENIGKREFTGTWVADELRKAISLGYQISEIFILWQYEITELDPRTGEGGLFSEYVACFLRQKQQASDYPAWCVDEALKDVYIRDYYEKEGIMLERDKIEKNAGLRTVAKLCLNSFWGKFGQRSNLKQTEIIKKREDLLKLLVAEDKEVLSVLIVSEEILYVNWRYVEEAVEPTPFANVVIAAYTTAQARLKLYSHLEKLGRRTLYFDTDSCIFVSNTRDPSEYSPLLGSLLGDMTDELKGYGQNAYITQFISGGPKFYGYRVVDPSTGQVTECCKVKGISLNFSNSLKINFNSIKRMIDEYFNENETDEESKCIKINFNAIRRTADHDVVTRKEYKTCSIVLKKRRYVSHTVSYPYGFKK